MFSAAVGEKDKGDPAVLEKAEDIGGKGQGRRRLEEDTVDTGNQSVSVLVSFVGRRHTRMQTRSQDLKGFLVIWFGDTVADSSRIGHDTATAAAAKPIATV